MTEESVERRVLTKRNDQQNNGAQTQSWNNTTSCLLDVREIARKDKKMQFTNLLKHLTPSLLNESFYELKRHAAAGIDGMNWIDYEKGLEDRLTNLNERVHKGTYRPKPARRVFIPKEDGSKRPLSIICLEDKIVQQAVVKILNSIYETDFMGFSYGFRPGKSQHHALDSLCVGIRRMKVNWILDMDISKFFDTVDHVWLIRFINHRVKDRRVIRLILKWLKVGVMEENGSRMTAKRGTPQGAVISPLLANIYLHYVFDQWANRGRKEENRGDIIIVRYADDVIIGFQYEGKAKQFLEEVKIRFGKFGLAIHPEKTKLIRFGRYANEQLKERKDGNKAETFDFLGFTHCCSKTRSGEFCIKRLTSKKRLRKKITEISMELKKRLHQKPAEVGRWLRSVVQGHINYYGVPFNAKAISLFCYEVRTRWYKTLCRRSQRKKINWEKFGSFVKHWIPNPKIVHPFPEERFLVTNSR